MMMNFSIAAPIFTLWTVLRTVQTPIHKRIPCLYELQFPKTGLSAPQIGFILRRVFSYKSAKLRETTIGQTTTNNIISFVFQKRFVYLVSQIILYDKLFVF